MNASPTTSQFASYQGLFDFFNAELFGGELPNCILNFSRHANSLGFFVPAVWAETCSQEKRAAEISLNPDHLGRGDKDSLSTLVHEMAHLWQDRFGKAPRKAYHDRQFAAKMEEIGLITSTTGQPGGKRVGQKMSHYIEANGAYERAYNRLPASLLLPWRTIGSLEGAEKEKAKKPKSKFKYTCPVCEAAAWGKKGLSLICGDCDQCFEMEEGEDDGEE